MKNVAKLVDDPRLKQKLKDTTGIGTEATRAGIIRACSTAAIWFAGQGAGGDTGGVQPDRRRAAADRRPRHHGDLGTGAGHGAERRNAVGGIRCQTVGVDEQAGRTLRRTAHDHQRPAGGRWPQRQTVEEETQRHATQRSGAGRENRARPIERAELTCTCWAGISP